MDCEEKYELRAFNSCCNLHDHAFALSMLRYYYLGGQSLADDEFALQWLILQHGPLLLNDVLSVAL